MKSAIGTAAATATAARTNPTLRQPKFCATIGEHGKKDELPGRVRGRQEIPSRCRGARRTSARRWSQPDTMPIIPTPVPTPMPQVKINCAGRRHSRRRRSRQDDRAQPQEYRLLDADALHERSRERPEQSEKRDVDRDGKRDRRRRPAHIAFHRHHQDAGRRTNAGREQQNEERKRDDHPRVVKGTLADRTRRLVRHQQNLRIGVLDGRRRWFGARHGAQNPGTPPGRFSVDEPSMLQSHGGKSAHAAARIALAEVDRLQEPIHAPELRVRLSGTRRVDRRRRSLQSGHAAQDAAAAGLPLAASRNAARARLSLVPGMAGRTGRSGSRQTTRKSLRSLPHFAAGAAGTLADRRREQSAMESRSVAMARRRRIHRRRIRPGAFGRSARIL